MYVEISIIIDSNKQMFDIARRDCVMTTRGWPTDRVGQ